MIYIVKLEINIPFTSEHVGFYEIEVEAYDEEEATQIAVEEFYEIMKIDVYSIEAEEEE